MNPYEFSEIDAIAREIRRHYIERKNQLFKGKFKLPKNIDFSNWQKAAEVCYELGAPPEAYVDAAFSSCTMSTGPYANTLAGTAVKRWYKEHYAGRFSYREQKQKAAEANRDAMFDEDTNTYVSDLKYEILLVKRSLMRLTRTDEINEHTMEYINSLTTGYPVHVRVLLGYKDPAVKDLFGQAALQFYTTRPQYIRAAQTLGYPIHEILLWLRSPQL